MAALKLTACMKVVAKMGDMDQEVLLERLDRYTEDGVPRERAQIMAASDTLAELMDERREFMAMLRQQHPDIFTIPEDQDVDPENPDLMGQIRFSPRRDPDPEETVTAYKLFRVDERAPGQLFPLFVKANEPVPMGVWLDADVGEQTEDGKVKSKLGPLAFRPGWHAGDLPIATHIGGKSDSKLKKPDVRPENHVWAEVEMAADVDWQEEANRRGTNSKGKLVPVKAHITDQVPVNGFYRYKTNPNMTGNWLIGGSMRVKRILSDAEVEEINRAAGVSDLPRTKPFDAKKYGLEIKRSPERDVTDTPEFKRWFGDSKVVDESGEPLVVYHGTIVRPTRDGTMMGDIQAFDRMFTTRFRAASLDTVGSWFSTNPGEGGAEMYSGSGQGGAIYPVYLSIKNPQVTTFQLMTRRARLLHNGKDDGRMIGAPEVEAYRKWLKEMSKDGIKIEGSGNDGSTEFDNQVAWIALEPEQIKSAIGNNGQFDPENPDIRMSPERDPLGFYSALADEIEKMPTKQAPAGAWKAQIKGLVNKGAVKQDEIEWSGLNDWLDLQEGKISKEAVLDYLEQGGVRVEEVVLGDDPSWIVRVAGDNTDHKFDSREEAEDWIDEQVDMAVQDKVRSYWSDAEYDEAKSEERDRYITYAPGEWRSVAKFQEWKTPGGENYREILLTLPTADERARAKAKSRMMSDADRDRYMELEQRSRRGEASDAEKAELDRLQKVMEGSQAAYRQALAEDAGKDFISKHWDHRNVLVHMRVDDRMDDEGNRVLFVQEIQSDWGQQGREEGFNKPPMKGEVRLQDGYDPVAADSWEAEDGPRRPWAVYWEDGSYSGGFNTREQAEYRLRTAAQQKAGGVPLAPFVNKTDGWLNLALKRIMVMAAEGDYDKVAFATGQQNAERFDLSKQVQQVMAQKEGDKFHVFMRDNAGKNHDAGVFSADELDGVVGKDLAQKIAAQKKGYDIYEGVDLKVGGDGMRAFYDQIVPAAIKDLLKKLKTGATMETINISDAAEDFDPWDLDSATDEERAQLEATGRVGGLVQPGFPVTDAMREKVEQGLPLFSRKRNPQEDTDEFRQWFGDSKVVDEDGKPLVVYHGTDADFSVFDTERGIGGGAWFARNVDTANDYALPSRFGAANVMPVYLRIENPMILSSDKYEPGAAARKAKASKTHDGLIYRTPYEDVYVVFRPEQIKSAVGNRGAFDPNDADITRSPGRTSTGADWNSPSASKWDDLVYKLQDKNIDTKRIVDAIKDAAGSISDDLNVYLQEELYHGRTAKRTEDFVNLELNPLVEQLSKDGLKLEDLEEFLHARHAPEANKVIAQRNPGEPDLQDGGSGMKTADALDYMANLPADVKAKLEAAAAKVDSIIASTRQLYVDYELESKDTVDGWTKMFQHYIPLQREDKNGSPGLGQGFSVKGRETKGRTGSTRKVVDILANIAMQREKAIVRGEKNRVAQALVGLANANPNEGFWKVDIVPTERVFNPNTGLVEDRVDPLYKSRENAVIAKIKDADGKVREHAVLFNEEDERAMRMAGALKNLEMAQLEGLMGVSAMITRYFAASVTQWNPLFGPVNMIRDVQGVALNLSSTPLKGDERKVLRSVMPALAGVYRELRANRKGSNTSSQWAQLWDEFQNVGGQTGYRELFRTSADRAEAIKKVLDPDAWADSRLGKIFTANGVLKVPLAQARRAAAWIFDWLSDYNDALENGVRLAVYKAGLDRGLSKEQAASIAKNASTNFNRKGQIGQQAGALYAFFNAAVQGTARIGTTLFDMEPGKPKTMRLSGVGKKIVGGGILLGAIQALALAAAGFDDEDPPQFARERSLIIPIGDKKYLSIPMPLGFNVIPNIGRIATEFALGGFKDPHERAVQLISLFSETFNPIGSAGLSMQTLAPTALDPLVALTENKDWTGKPIARESSNPAIPGHQLAKDTATTWSKAISEAINTLSGGNQYVAGVFSPSPDQIDYLLGWATGGVGREIAKLDQTVTSLAYGEELPPYKVPLLGRFYGNARSQASEGTMFYANTARLNELETEIKGLQKDGKYQEAAELRRSNSDAYLITMANQAERQIQRLRQEKRELIKNDAPREQVAAIEERITQVMARLNRAAERLREAQQ